MRLNLQKIEAEKVIRKNVQWRLSSELYDSANEIRKRRGLKWSDIIEDVLEQMISEDKSGKKNKK